ncbi:MAG TPA: aminoacyl-tRNA hydrolase [Actinomycetes bacterium]|nr:aminoacyl-tRNA hydrolase [Actinomycetes bacterium]
MKIDQGQADEDSRPWVIVGLGNPGQEYEGHRHNIGFRVVDELGQRLGGSFRRHKRARGLALEGRSGGHRIVLFKPTTYMNEAGQAVSPLTDFYKAGPDRVIAIHDELDLPFGSLRLKFGGGDNGHNGLKSLRQSLGTGDFFRARWGIGRPPGRLDPAVFVLRNFSASERGELEAQVGRTADAVEALINEGLERAQSQFND